MFGWWGRVVVRWRWAVLAAALGFVAVGASWRVYCRYGIREAADLTDAPPPVSVSGSG